MKKFHYFNSLMLLCFTLLAANIITSCDSCNRDNPEKIDTIENGDETLSEDTLINDHTNSSGLNTPQSSNRGSGNGRTSTTQNSQDNTSTGTGGTSTGYGDSNSPIENSSTPSTQNGQPIRSSGAAGTGQGTGTGSTGNNTKVTRPEDQN